MSEQEYMSQRERGGGEVSKTTPSRRGTTRSLKFLCAVIFLTAVSKERISYGKTTQTTRLS